MITIKVDEKSQNELKRYLKNYTKETLKHIQKSMEWAGVQIESECKRLMGPLFYTSNPGVTGRARSSVHWKTYNDGTKGDKGNTISLPLRPLEVIIGSNVEYFEVLEEGSKPHVIRPKNKKALRFTIGNQVIFAKQVNHPGTKGHHMLKNAYDKIVPKFFERLNENLKPK